MTLIKTTYNRRSFLKRTAVAGGGFMLGFSMLASCTSDGEKILRMPDEWFDINAFLKIGDNGIATIFSKNPEIGQNVKTSMPMIVAEELDIPWERVVVEQAALDTEKYQDQFAGGSLSIRRGWEGLRMAGATARRMLMEAAAQKWAVPVSELETGEGKVKHPSSGQEADYGELASLAMDIEVPEEVELKDPKDFKLIGTSRKNVDGLKIVTGQPLFGLDVDREGMRIAMYEHAPAFGMKLKSVDASRAESMPGIEQVFTFTTQTEGENGQRPEDEFVAVVGRSTWEVLQAKKALRIEWEPAGTLESSRDHATGLAQLMERSKPASEWGRGDRRDGNPEAAFANADQILERTYTAPFMAHNTMEPMNFFAHVTGDRVELLGPIQTPGSLRRDAAKMLGVEEDKIDVMMTRQGGGFGRRLYGNFGLEAAMISKKAGVPVKLVYTREDDMTQGTYRPAYRVVYRAALDKDKNVTAFHVKGGGTNSGVVFPNRFPAGTVDNYLAESYRLESNITTGAWRAPRSHFMAIAEQCFLDEVAEACGKDPVDFRLALFERAINDPVGKDNDYDPERYAGVLKLVKEKADWGSEKPGVYRGVSAYFCHNSYVAQVLDLAIENGQPVVKKIWCAVDCGIVVNPDAARNQIEGGIVDGIGHAMYSALTFQEGKPEQNNFNQYRLIRNGEAPQEIEVFFVDNGIDPTGLGEPSLPPVAAALANALYRATGERLYDQPFAGQNQLVG